MIGPLVVAAVRIGDEEKLKALGVRDSKELLPHRREYLANEIVKIAGHQIIKIEASDIDRFREQISLNEIEIVAFSKLINELDANEYFLDAVGVDLKKFRARVQAKLENPKELVASYGADKKFPVVSAASILAKVARDKAIREIASSLEQRINLPLGSGYPSDPKTIQFLVEWIRQFNEIPPHVRHSWATLKRIYQKKLI
ncbi:MAG TPA: ribonuclease HII [Thermoplasmata archaeon]|nr:ribonuclease HII [Thermoplasmata archaeon]HIH98544.1 ribonuclease HII [Thermoplasmata archaeon]